LPLLDISAVGFVSVESRPRPSPSPLCVVVAPLLPLHAGGFDGAVGGRAFQITHLGSRKAMPITISSGRWSSPVRPRAFGYTSEI
jgi:hypothetical protein